MARKRRRKKRFRMQPRFFLVLLVLAALAVGTVFLVKKIKEKTAPETDAEATPLPTATAAPTATPKPALPANVTVVRSENANPSKFGFETEIMANGKSTTSYSRSDKLSFGRDTEYTGVSGLLTFGGNNYRNTFTFGVQTVTEKRLREVWSKSVGAISSWSGTGWTGMPLIVHWPDETLRVMNVAEKYKTQETGLTEVIYPAMDGNIYFYELETGEATRNPIATGIVQKGTACVDPTGKPVLYVGQGIPVPNEKNNNAAYVRAYSLIDQTELTTFGGYDYFSRRVWQAYDGSPMITNDTIVYGGENGVLYTYKLNTSFDPAAGTVSINPDRPVKFKYLGAGYSKVDGVGARWLGIESSVAAFRNYAYFTDNGGRLQCLDLNTMQLKFVTDLTDETDATPVLEESFDDNTVYLYTGSQVRNADGSAGENMGYSYQRKINGMTGDVVWEKKLLCSTGDGSNSGGILGTPHVGRYTSNISNLVIYAVSCAAVNDPNVSASAPQAAPAAGDGAEPAGDATEAPVPEEAAADTASAATTALGGRIIAYDKTTGDVMWTITQTEDYWSSPVVIYDASGKAYLIQCDRAGIVTMYDAATSSQVTTLDLGSRIDSTPAVYGDYLVVGTRGKGGAGKAAKICCVKIS